MCRYIGMSVSYENSTPFYAKASQDRQITLIRLIYTDYYNYFFFNMTTILFSYSFVSPMSRGYVCFILKSLYLISIWDEPKSTRKLMGRNRFILFHYKLRDSTTPKIINNNLIYFFHHPLGKLADSYISC